MYVQYLIKEFPSFQSNDIEYQVYQSIVLDVNSVTLVSPKSDLTSLTQRLATKGLTLRPLDLEGRFHSPILESSFLKISDFCCSNPGIQLPNAKQLLVPLRSHCNGQVISDGSLHDIALRSILTEMANWHLIMSSATQLLDKSDSPVAVSLGFVDSIPATVAREVGLRITRFGDVELSSNYSASSESVTDSRATLPPAPNLQDKQYPDNAIAIVGMACKFPGADSIDGFWQIIESGASMCQQVPPERFSTERLRRTAGQSHYWGNFINDVNAFDHRFFNISKREAASMDPQQRLLLQVAYEAMESSGYFEETSRVSDDIGCYLGVCATDYDDNVSSHKATAFSSVGTLRAFLSGRISHYFGWVGPSITYDTACSSSAVAVDAACKAINLGDCSTAIAGGASIFTSPWFFQNLTAASFLSPTGATKPFDADADGYCRGEGVGLVVLRRLDDAVARNDNILGVIAATAVNQNSNLTSITIPHSPSQIRLFRKIIAQAGIESTDVSYVEAHGTGTPIGDPLEMESIRKVFGGPRRVGLLHVASVKGNIGHTEGASGIAALIKTVLMMQHETIPVQANFTTLNPKIAPLIADRMAIPLTTGKWNAEYKIACINNYGAAGSNAGMIVCQAPLLPTGIKRNKARWPKYPIFISAKSFASLSSSCAAIQAYIIRLIPTISSPEVLLEDLAFGIAIKYNRSFSYKFTASVASLSDLNDKLAATASREAMSQTPAAPNAKPLVLVFGGQTGQTIGLSKAFYNASALFRSHLDSCDGIMRSVGHGGLYPRIFQKEPLEDIVSLHGMLFSLQYSCAQAWIDSGLQIDSIIGHSFGQLTALSVSGSLSLEDGLKLVLNRALLMQKHWGPEVGGMISIEADLATTTNIIAVVGARDSSHKLEIACYNGPTSHVLVGAESAVKACEATLASLATAKYKILNVTHGFHSELTNPLLLGLKDYAEGLTFMEPTRTLETCSDGQSWIKIKPELIAEHTRAPVYFGQAVKRLAHRLGPCTWLEAGSKSSVTSMLRHSLGKASSSQHAFYTISLETTAALTSLADLTADLWNAGYKMQFWPFHECQKSEYGHCNLPTYQFEKSRHWIEWIDEAQKPTSLKKEIFKEISKSSLLSFVRFHDQDQRRSEFFVDSESEQYQLFVQGHGVLDNPVCPASLYIEVVSQAALTLISASELTACIPRVDSLEMITPIGCSSDLTIVLILENINVTTWSFAWSSRSRMKSSDKASDVQIHATGKISLEEPASHDRNDSFERSQRRFSYQRYENLITSSKAERMQGSIVYKVFGRVVQYADYYKGVYAVSANAHEVAGQVELSDRNVASLRDTVCNPLAIDNFMQVAGIRANCMNDCSDNEVYMSTKIDQIQLSRGYDPSNTRAWCVYSNSSRTSERQVSNDIYVYDSNTKTLVLRILGACFTKVLITSLKKVLPRVKMPRLRAELMVDGTSAVRNTLHNSSGISTIQRENSLPNALVPKSVLDSTGDCSAGFLTEVGQAPNDGTQTPDFENARDLKTSSGRVLSDWSVDSMRSTPGSGQIRDTSYCDPLFLEDERIPQLVKLVGDFLEADVPITASSCLADLGLDSLLSMELASDIEISYAVKIDITRLDYESTFGDLCDIVLRAGEPAIVASVGPKNPLEDTPASRSPITTTPNSNSIITPAELANQGLSSLIGIQQAFEQVRHDYDRFAEEMGKANFWKEVYPTQARLVEAYVVEAFATLGCSLASLKPGERIPQISTLPKHVMLRKQLFRIINDASLILSDGIDFVRSEKVLDSTPAKIILEELLEAYPDYALENRLLHITGARLAECLTGATDPLQLLFQSKENKKLMEEVYVKTPLCTVISKLLCSFLGKALGTYDGGGKINILEVGGGTGGTTMQIVDSLLHQGIPFNYTFTDIAPSLIAAARKKFSTYGSMEFVALDVEKPPPEIFKNQFDVIISINCIHATSNLTASSRNLRQMLRGNGFVSLVEFTRNISWFDLVYGLLKGWWLFNDGRRHALADENFWADSMRAAGFKHISWTDGVSFEARTIRIITGFTTEPDSPLLIPKSVYQQRKARIETLVFQKIGRTLLCADVYYPSASDVSQAKRPIGTLFSCSIPFLSRR